MNDKKLERVNSPMSYWRIKYDDSRVVPMPAGDFPTCDTYRVQTDSEDYTCDNEGS